MKNYQKILNALALVVGVILFCLAIAGCTGTSKTYYGVSCDQNGHLSQVYMYSDGTVQHAQSGDMNPAAQACRIQEDGSILIHNLKLP